MRWLSIAALLLALAACGGEMSASPAPLVYKPPASAGGRQCLVQCDRSRDYCGESCDLDYRACYGDAQAAAQRAYDVYAAQQYAHRLPIEKVPSDFQQTAACDSEKKKCLAGCDTPYNACYQLCGGTVSEPD